MITVRALLLITPMLPVAVCAQVAPAQSATEISQIPSGATAPLIPAVEAAATAEAPSQLASSSQRNSPTPQLTSAGEVRVPAEQVSREARDARPPEPLSSAAEGRTSAVEAVEGEDRCDPAKRDKRERSCANVIENRASQYSRTEAPRLSPEQRLMVDQQAREAATTFQGAARRLAQSGASDDSLETMGVASVALSSSAGRPPEQENPNEPAANEAAAAIINAIVNGGSSPPPE